MEPIQAFQAIADARPEVVAPGLEIKFVFRTWREDLHGSIGNRLFRLKTRGFDHTCRAGSGLPGSVRKTDLSSDANVI
jgi:hypothetical protein